MFRYGRLRGVKVIPEFDVPGHVHSGWEWLNGSVDCTGSGYEVRAIGHLCAQPPCGCLNPTDENVFQVE